MKTAQPKKNRPTTSPLRVLIIIALTLAAVFVGVVLFAMLARHHGAIPYEQQTYLKIPLVTAALGKRGKSDKATEVPPDGYEPLDRSHPLFIKLQSQIDFGGTNDSNKIREALTVGGGPYKYDLIAKGEADVKQVPRAQSLASDEEVWRETRQWCVKLRPGSGNESLGAILWRLSSVKGASEIGLEPRKIYFNEPPLEIAEQIGARFPDGFLLPVQSNSYGDKKTKVTNTFWSLATDSKICPAFTTLPQNDQLDQALKQVQAESRSARSRNEEMSAAITGMKSVVMKHFETKRKWPTNNFNAGFFAPAAYLNTGDMDSPRIISISVEPDVNTARIQVEYLNDSDEVQRLVFCAPANGETESWECGNPK